MCVYEEEKGSDMKGTHHCTESEREEEKSHEERAEPKDVIDGGKGVVVVVL